MINNYESFTLSINHGNANYNENHPSTYLHPANWKEVLSMNNTPC